MKAALDHLRAAFTYFSILPAGGPPTFAPGAQTLVALPLVGACTGALGGAAAFASSFVAPHAIVVAVAFAAPIILTGAIHLDGFLDSCDALFATVPVQRRLEIFRDPHHGSFALAGLAVAVACWLGALSAVPAPALPAVLAFCGALSRWAVVPNALFVPYARGGAVTAVFSERPSIAVLTFAGMVLALWGWTLAGGWGLGAVPVALGGALLAGHRLKRRLGGGLVGDVYGYLIVCCEVAALAGFAIFYARTIA